MEHAEEITLRITNRIIIECIALVLFINFILFISSVDSSTLRDKDTVHAVKDATNDHSCSPRIEGMYFSEMYSD